MACWSENYHFIKEVYDFRVDEMNKWMDALEESSKKLITNKVYTSREFRRMRDQFRVSSSARRGKCSANCENVFCRL